MLENKGKHHRLITLLSELIHLLYFSVKHARVSHIVVVVLSLAVVGCTLGITQTEGYGDGKQ